jgi:hypothetical protein
MKIIKYYPDGAGCCWLSVRGPTEIIRSFVISFVTGTDISASEAFKTVF